MVDQRRKGRLALELILGGLLLVVILGGLLVGARRRWIDPVPGVRLEMSRPPITETDLGPGSAYQLLLKATRKPRGMPTQPAPVWGHPWAVATMYDKLLAHPWPAKLPPTMAERLAELEAREKAAYAKQHGEGNSPEPAEVFTSPPPTPKRKFDGFPVIPCVRRAVSLRFLPYATLSRRFSLAPMLHSAAASSFLV